MPGPYPSKLDQPRCHSITAHNTHPSPRSSHCSFKSHPSTQITGPAPQVNQHGSEGKLAAAFKAESDRFKRSQGEPGLTYCPFDFHKECGATRYDRLSKLMDLVVPGGKLPHGQFTQVRGARCRGVLRGRWGMDLDSRDGVACGVLTVAARALVHGWYALAWVLVREELDPGLQWFSLHPQRLLTTC